MQKHISYIFCTIALLITLPSCLQTEQNKEFMTEHTKAPQATKHLRLFVYNNCPYCKKVVKFLKDNNIAQYVEIVDLAYPANMKELERLNNYNTQAPFLHDVERNVRMLESADIIAYLKKRFLV